MNSKKLMLADRLKGLEENVWMDFWNLWKTHKPINLGQGAPDFAAPKHLRNAVIDVMLSDNERMTQYCNSNGVPRLLNVLAKFYSKLVGRDIDPQTDVLITNGASQALHSAIMGNVNPGDEVILIEPIFDLFLAITQLAGAVLVCVPLRPSKPGEIMSSNDWKLDEKELASKFNSKTKAIIINTPHNPIGKVFKRHELEVIADLAKKWNVLVITDEVYEFSVFNGNEHVRMASLPGMWERTLTIGSAGKSFSATGFKVGWTYGPKHLINNCNMYHQICVYRSATMLQEAVAACFELELERYGSDESYFEQLKVMLKTKRDKLVECLEQSGLVPVIPDGSPYVIVDFSEMGRRCDFDDGSSHTDDYKFSKWLCSEKNISAIPLSGFYGESRKHLAGNYIRFCFIKEDSTLEAGGKILLELKNS